MNVPERQDNEKPKKNTGQLITVGIRNSGSRPRTPSGICIAKKSDSKDYSMGMTATRSVVNTSLGGRDPQAQLVKIPASTTSLQDAYF